LPAAKPNLYGLFALSAPDAAAEAAAEPALAAAEAAGLADAGDAAAAPDEAAGEATELAAALGLAAADDAGAGEAAAGELAGAAAPPPHAAKSMMAAMLPAVSRYFTFRTLRLLSGSNSCTLRADHAREQNTQRAAVGESAIPDVIAVTNVSKAFGAVQALSHVDFKATPGEVHALMGENGSGKSTLVNIIAGRTPADSCAIELDGRPLTIRSPHEARQAGIALVSQDLQLVPALSVAENIYLGLWPGGGRLTINPRTMEREASALLGRLKIDVHPRKPVGALSQDRRQLVEVARALASNPRVLLLDEPTSALMLDQVETVFDLLRELREQGLCIVFVSHRLKEIFQVADRVTVLRDGKNAGTVAVPATTEADLVRLMVGRSLQNFYDKHEVEIGPPLLEVRNLSRGILRNVSLSVRAGEIVGVAGLAGSGRSALARTLFGLRRAWGGDVLVNGTVVNPRRPADAMAAGIALIPENRKEQGLIQSGTVRQNMTLAALYRRSSFGWLHQGRERQTARRFVDELRIKTPGVDTPIRHLSGGNQQKVVLAKWLLMDPKVLVLDEPTQGVDIGAKAEIYQVIGKLVAERRGVLLISSELPELLALSDRIVTMYRGRVSSVIDRAAATEELVAKHIVTGE